MEKFFLKIDATSEDGVEVNQLLEAKIQCSKETAIGVMVHTLKENVQIRDILLMAVEAYLDEKTKERIRMN